jgi:acyl-CoA synthetase (AMP-forming)/AMP-acid ligase II
VAAFAVEGDASPALVIVGEVERQALGTLDSAAVAAAIRRHVRQGHGLEPCAVALLRPATLPKTSSGKTQRRRCRELYLAGKLETLTSATASPASSAV